MCGQEKTNQIIIRPLRSPQPVQGSEISKYSPDSERANRNPSVCLWKFVLFVFSRSLPLPPHIFTFFPLFKPCWQVYHLTSSPELWSPNNGRYKGGNSFRVEIFPITTHRPEWSHFLSDIIINQHLTNISFNPSGWTGLQEGNHYRPGCGCLFVTGWVLCVVILVTKMREQSSMWWWW